MTTSSTATDIPDSTGATMSLPVDGGLVVHDSVNTFSGRFTATADTLDVGPTVSTLVGYGGDEPIRIAAINALDILTGSTGTPVHSSVSHPAGGTLVVQLQGIILRFADAGPAPATDPRVLQDNP